MVNPQVVAALYLAPSARSFWRWTGDAEILTWVDGTTIAFRPEIEGVLRRLAPGGLPPFPAVALLLAACREPWTTAAHRTFTGLDPAVARHGNREARPLPPWLTEVLTALERVGRLRPELRTGVEAKSLLAEAVFEGARFRGTPEDALMVVQAFSEGVNPEALSGEPGAESAFAELQQDLEPLRVGLERIDAESLELRTRTGLDRLVGRAEVELPACERVRLLVQQLKDDRELAGLSRLVSDLMAAVHVPRAMTQRDDLPLGGVSDIANRGPLDRLLTSELAHDELTFAVRLATHEALYLRREAPPRLPPGRRLILLDAGIRLWGVPRVFATAVGLALAATADRQIHVRCWRARADGLEPVDLATRSGLVAHLEALEPAPHPGAALAPFLALAGEGEEPSDAILVTHEEVLADPEFIAAHAAVADRPLYVATVARDGTFRLLAWSRRGSRKLREARLSLAALFVADPASGRIAPPLVEPRSPGLPEILGRQPFPLLMPHTPDPHIARWSKEHGVVALLADGRILHWKKPGRGAHQCTAAAPRGSLFGAGIERDGLAWFLVGAQPRQRMNVVTVDLRSGECAVREEPADPYPPIGTCTQFGVVFVIFRRLIRVLRPGGGDPVQSVALPTGVRWRHGRFFFQYPDHWHALTFDGLGARLERVPIGGHLQARRILALFDREGLDGPWAVLDDGRVHSLGNELGLHFSLVGQTALQVTGISRDGHRLTMRGRGKDGATWEALLDLTTKRPTTFRGGRMGMLEPEIGRWTLSGLNLRHKFDGVCFDDQGRLGLRSTKGGQMWLHSIGPMRSLTWLGGNPGVGREFLGFSPAPRPAGGGYGLQMATWRDGSRAYLDARGLLHLKSSDPSLPELTLVLIDGPAAAWSSDGLRHGQAYFHGEATVVDGRVFLDVLERFAARVR